MERTFLVLVQVPGADEPTGELVPGQSGDTAREIGVDHATRLDEELGDDWRVLVWAVSDDGDYDVTVPDAVVTPADLRAPSGARRVARAGKKYLPPRVRATPGQVVSKVRASADLLGRRILVTQHKRNTNAPFSSGPWFPANEPGPDVVAATVQGYGEPFLFRDREVCSLLLSVGSMHLLPPNVAVVPVEA